MSAEKQNEHIRFFEFPTARKYPRAAGKAAWFAWVGDELYLPAITAYPSSQMEACLCAAADGVPMMLAFEILFVPAWWVRKHCPQRFRKWVDVIIKKAEKVR